MRSLNWGTDAEALYRVDVFRRFIPNRGTTGAGLLQFWGPKAVRRKAAKKGAKWSKWEVGPEGRLHTLEVSPRDMEVR